MYYIFNNKGEFVSTADFKPNLEDLASRGEVAVESEQSFVYPFFSGETIIDKGIAPSIYHVWNGNSWAIEDEKKEKIKAQQQIFVWEQIKQKRYNNGRLGVYVKSVDKWFHSDDASRQQYTFMRTLADFPPTQWKTMDNTFVTMTKDLLNELSLAMFTNEQADFANAEKHRLAMLEADNPQDYDYSTGWREVYHGE